MRRRFHIGGGGTAEWIAGLAILLAAGTVQGAEVVTSGPISGDVTWSGEISMVGDVTIPSGARLTLSAGTRVVVDANADRELGGNDTRRSEIIVDGGLLVCLGSEAEPILITSSAETPKKADWGGIIMKSGGITLRYTTAEFTTTGLLIQGGEAGTSETPALTGCVFRQSQLPAVETYVPIRMVDSTLQTSQYGLVLRQPGLAATLTRCSIQENLREGVWTQRDAALNLNDSTLRGNGGSGVFCQGVVTVQGGLVTANAGHGIQAASANVSNSEVTTNNVDGVAANSAQIANCKLTGNARNGAYLAPGRDAMMSVAGSTITGNKNVGILLTGAGAIYAISGNLIQGNRFGLYCQLLPAAGADVVSLNLRGNDILGNADADLWNDSGAGLAIEEANYWGEQTTQELQTNVTDLSHIHDRRDDPRLGQVVIRSFSPTSVLSGSLVRKGDVDLNRTVNILDVLLSIRAVARLAELSPEQQTAGDIDGNQSVDIRDVLSILRAVAGLVQLPS